MIFTFDGSTLSLKDNIYNAGVRLESISYQIDDGELTEAEVTDGKTVDLSKVLALGVEIVYLEAIELDFVEPEPETDLDIDFDVNVGFNEAI